MGADEELLAKLRAREVSRNRNFDLFDRPSARRALRLHLLLQQLERSLLQRRHGRSVKLLGRNGCNGEERRYVLEIEDEELRLRRQVFLSERELALLLEQPDIARLLGVSGRWPGRTP